jgi:hypothetical protein
VGIGPEGVNESGDELGHRAVFGHFFVQPGGGELDVGLLAWVCVEFEAGNGAAFVAEVGDGAMLDDLGTRPMKAIRRPPRARTRCGATTGLPVSAWT